MRASRSDGLGHDGRTAEFPGWSLIRVTGRHRERFLASQVTSDVAGLAEGESQLSSLLDRSGRLQAFFFVLKRPESLELLIPEDLAASCTAAFESRVIADDVVFDRVEVAPMRLALGPSALAEARGDARYPVAGWGSRGFVTWGDDDLPWSEMDPAELDARRVLGGPPVWGREVCSGQLVNETVLLDSAVSFDKGCYLGQETVAKVASRRGAARGPAILETTDADIASDPRVGAFFEVEGRSRAGQVVAAADWDEKTWLAVTLRREFRVAGREIRYVFDDGRTGSAVIHQAPLLPAPTLQEIADRLTTEASSRYAGDRIEEALELLNRAMAVCPEWGDAHEAAGVILGRLGRHQEAIEAMHRLLEIDPSSVMAHSNLSLFHNQLGDKETAEHHLAMATRLSMGGGASSAATEPEEQATEDDHRRREKMYLQVLEIDSDDALAHFGLGELALERGRFGDAVNHLEQAIVGDPAHAAAILALGTALEAQRSFDRAREVYERGVDVAAKKGDTSSAAKMQERLNTLAQRAR